MQRSHDSMKMTKILFFVLKIFYRSTQSWKKNEYYWRIHCDCQRQIDSLCRRDKVQKIEATTAIFTSSRISLFFLRYLLHLHRDVCNSPKYNEATRKYSFFCDHSLSFKTYWNISSVIISSYFCQQAKENYVLNSLRESLTQKNMIRKSLHMPTFEKMFVTLNQHFLWTSLMQRSNVHCGKSKRKKVSWSNQKVWERLP